MMHENTPERKTVPVEERRVSGVSVLIIFQGGCHILFTLFGLLIFLTTIASYMDLGERDQFIEDYLANWDLKPLIDIKAVKSTRCPEDYEMLLTREFGTIQGGDCLEVSSQSNKIYKDSCDVNQATQGCQNILPMDKSKLNKFYGYNFCGLRAGNSFLEVERPKLRHDNLTCSDGNKIGGSGDINTSFGVDIEQVGPINDAYVIEKNTPFDDQYYSDDLDDGYKFIFTRQGENMPIVRFSLTESKVGFNSNGYQTSRQRLLYPLIEYGKCHKFIRTRTNDPRYKNVGKIREDKLFNDNEIYNVVKSLPGYPIEDSKKYDWNLYLNNYFYWSHYGDGSSLTTRRAFYDILVDIINVKDQNSYILETSIFHALGIGMVVQYFFSYFTLIIWKNRDDINRPMRTFFHVVGYPIKIGSLVFLLYFCYHCIKTISKYQDMVISVTVSEGAPEFTTQAFFAYEESLQSVYHITYRITILAGFSMVLVIFDLGCELGIRGILQTTYGRFYDDFIT